MPAIHNISWIGGLGLPAFLFVVTLVVFFHELGHFLAARLFGIAVETFSIGFGHEIVGFTDRKGTRWKISWIPLGGYVRFFGDADASSRPDRQAIEAARARRLERAKPREEVRLAPVDHRVAAAAAAGGGGAIADVHSTVPAAADRTAGMLHVKPLYQRAIVAAAGPIANFILAIVIFTIVVMASGKPAEPPVIEQVTAGSAAEAADLRPGDQIRSVDGQTIHVFADLQKIVGTNAGKPIHIVVMRNGREVAVEATPTTAEVTDATGVKHSVGRLGIRDATVSVGPLEAFKDGVGQTWFILRETVSYLAKLVTGQEGPEQLHGILGIGQVAGQAARVGFIALLGLAGLMSVSIGLINLLPIPVLDGGHLLYYGCEAILGRPLGERAQEVGFRLGLAFVLCLMLLATFNDFVRPL
jgi:regulator of sigma E protease